MSSAAQIAARKKFAAIMKSGGFPKKRGAAKKTAKRKKNPMPAPPPGQNYRRTLNAAPKRAAKKAAPRRANPAHRAPSGFVVHVANAYGEPGAKLATFVTKPLAVEYANGYANKHKKSVCIVGKK